jgi:hypothetical protein
MCRVWVLTALPFSTYYILALEALLLSLAPHYGIRQSSVSKGGDRPKSWKAILVEVSELD